MALEGPGRSDSIPESQMLPEAGPQSTVPLGMVIAPGLEQVWIPPRPEDAVVAELRLRLSKTELDSLVRTPAAEGADLGALLATGAGSLFSSRLRTAFGSPQPAVYFPAPVAVLRAGQGGLHRCWLLLLRRTLRLVLVHPAKANNRSAKKATLAHDISRSPLKLFRCADCLCSPHATSASKINCDSQHKEKRIPFYISFLMHPILD